MDTWCESGLDLDDLSERVAGLAGRINAATCEWLGLVAEADDRGAWQGFPTCAGWLSWLCGIGPGAASDHLRVARALRDLPLVRERFAAGGLSFSQVRALTRGAGVVDEVTLVGLAEGATGAQLERLIRALRRQASVHEENDAAAHQDATWFIDHDGSLVIKARLAGEAAATVMAALEAAGPAPYVERLVTVAERALRQPPDAAEDAAGRAMPATVTLVADLPALEEAWVIASGRGVESSAEDQTRTESSAEDRARSESSAEDSVSLPSPATSPAAGDPDAQDGEFSEPTVRWEPTGSAASTLTLATLLCDRQVQLVARLADGSLVDLGRSRRRPSPTIARAVLRRHDHRCAVPRCGARRHLHLHHVRHWAHGGPTSTANLVPLCGRHHRELHAEHLTIHAAPPPSAACGGKGPSQRTGRWTFRDRWGGILQPLAPAQNADGPPLSEDPRAEAAERSGVAMSRTPGRAERLDHEYALSVLLP